MSTPEAKKLIEGKEAPKQIPEATTPADATTDIACSTGNSVAKIIDKNDPVSIAEEAGYSGA